MPLSIPLMILWGWTLYLLAGNFTLVVEAGAFSRQNRNATERILVDFRWPCCLTSGTAAPSPLHLGTTLPMSMSTNDDSLSFSRHSQGTAM